MGKNDVPSTFAEIIENAQRVPEGIVNRRADLSSPFSVPLPPDHRVVNMDDEPEKIQNVPMYDYKAHVEYLVLPKDIERYEGTLNEILNAEAILRYEEKSFTKEGDCIIVICYLKPDPVKVAARKKKNARRGKDDDEKYRQD